MKKLTGLAIALILAFSLCAQDFPPKNIIPPSPIAREFQRFVGYPVSPATGLADISIPVYDLKLPGLTIPFSLKYHSDGIKVEQSPGIIGYGWSLFPGLMITRTIMGNPDDQYKTDAIPANAFYYGSTYTLTKQELYNMAPPLGSEDLPEKDGQYDIFTLHLPTQNVTFILQWDNGVLKARTLEESPLKIVPQHRQDGLRPYFSGFEVYDENGIKYEFGPGEPPAGITYTESVDVGGVTTSWLLRQITLPGVNNVVTFNYESAGTLNMPHRNESMTIRDNAQSWIEINDAQPGGGPCSQYLPSLGGAHISNTSIEVNGIIDPNYTLNALKTINFPTGRIELSYTNSYNYVLSALTVYNQNNKAVKTCNFTRQGGSSGYSMYLLTGLAITGEGEYHFEYNPQDIPAGVETGQDFSGYYNGKANSSLVPLVTLKTLDNYMGTVNAGTGSYGEADRTPDANYMQARVLQKVIYPTGGYTSFEYEPHHFISKEVEDFGLGLRVKKVNTYDPVADKTITKTYKYGINESGLGNLGLPVYRSNQAGTGSVVSTIDGLSFINEHYMLKVGPCVEAWRERTLSSDSKYSSFSFGVPVWYNQVTEYSDGGKTVYNYDYTASNLLTMLSPLSGQTLWNGTFQLQFQEDSYMPEVLNLTTSPRLSSKKIYNSAGDILQETTNTYSIVNSVADGIQGLVVEPRLYGSVSGDINNYNFLKFTPPLTDRLYDFYAVTPFQASGYLITTGSEKLLSTVQRTYQGSNYLETTINNNYQPGYEYNLASKVTTNSKNETVTEKYYYSTSDAIPDLNSTQQAMLTTLTNNNHLSAVVQKTSFNNSTPVNGTLYQYKDWGNNIIAPELVYAKTGNNAYESRLHFYNYDNKGNVLSVSKENDSKISYLWGYNQVYPIAQVTNAEATDIFFTSFEDADGNSSDGDSKTGQKSRTGGYSKALAGLTNGSYTLSYWQKNGTSWTLQKSDVTVSGNAYTISLSGQVDEVRFYPAAAQMATYTFDPLVGMTTQTDINDNPSYYEYDAFGRLVLIRDKDNNIVKKFCYNYAGQQSSCDFVGNAVKSQVFNMTGCDAALGKYGGMVTYTVPANTYFGATQPEADALAQADIDTKGQAYADANGTCLQGVTNDQKSVTFTKNNCSTGGVGSQVTYVVPIGRYAAATKTTANQLADADVTANGQTYANTNGYCTWYSDLQTQNFTKNDCGSDATASTVTYTVAANTYSSTVSKTDANAKATNDINTNGQSYANSHGYCTWYSDAIYDYFYKQNCSSGQTPDAYLVNIPPSAYSSTSSKADANSQARQYAQNLANTYGTCSTPAVPIQLEYYNQTSVDFTIDLYAPATGLHYQFTASAWNSGTQGVVPGEYNIQIYNWSDYDNHNFSVCDYSQYGSNPTFYSITIGTDCHAITIN